MPKFTIAFEIERKQCGSIEVEADDLEEAQQMVREDIDTLTLLDESGDEETNVTIHDLKIPGDEHEHVWGPLERSRLAGTVHRKCTVEGCKAINALDDEEPEEE